VAFKEKPRLEFGAQVTITFQRGNMTRVGGSGEYSSLRMPWKRPQVLGVDLNRSETAAWGAFWPSVHPVSNSNSLSARVREAAA
jgi:hypothetical protein